MNKASYGIKLLAIILLIISTAVNALTLTKPEWSQTYEPFRIARQSFIWLAAHASRFNLHEKHKPGNVYDPATFIDEPGV